MYLYLLCSKDEALDAFKNFKAKVENQYGNILRSCDHIEVESTMVNTQRMDKLLIHLRSFFKKRGLLPNTLASLSGS